MGNSQVLSAINESKNEIKREILEIKEAQNSMNRRSKG